MYDPAYMNYLEWAKSQGQKVAQKLPETEGEGVMESYCLMGTELCLWLCWSAQADKMKISQTRWLIKSRMSPKHYKSSILQNGLSWWLYW